MADQEEKKEKKKRKQKKKKSSQNSGIYTLIYTNLCKNVEAEINQNFKNALRTFLMLRLD